MAGTDAGRDNQEENQAMAQHGGARPGAGRKPGSKTRARKVEIVSLADKAKVHADVALATLVTICESGATDSARVAAANALLDRGYGKPTQGVEMSGDVGLGVTLVTRRIVDPDGTDD